ncbi:hypothetical protein DQU93_09885 [Staphylococcus aureus]|nr:hypothetical protein DQU93_09885 [Staphylococcus aureus]
MFLSLKTLYRKRTVIWPFYFYTIIRTLSKIIVPFSKTNITLLTLIKNNLTVYKVISKDENL